MNAVEYIYYSLVMTGIIIVIITLGLSSIIGYIVGYSFIAAGFFLLSGYLMFKLSNTSGFFSSLITIGPILLIVGVICYYLSIIGVYRNRITDGNVSNSYYSFSNIFLLLILLANIVLYNALQDKQFKQTNSINKINSMVTYLLGVFSIIVAITINIILAYFSTDG